MSFNGKKYAVFTADVESFGETECVRYSSLKVDDDMMDGLFRYTELLEKHGIRATLFSLLEAAEMYTAPISELLQKGHELALHGFNHTAPMLIEPDEFKAQTQSAKSRLESLFDVKIRGYRAPCFSLDEERLEAVRSLGFDYDASFMSFSKARHHAPLDFSRWHRHERNVFESNGFFEFGLVSGKLFGADYPASGGGYLRLMSKLLYRPFIKRCVRKNSCYVFYMHPFELSSERAPDLKRAKLYDKYYLTQGLSDFAEKIVYLIACLKSEGFEFITFSELSEKLKA